MKIKKFNKEKTQRYRVGYFADQGPSHSYPFAVLDDLSLGLCVAWVDSKKTADIVALALNTTKR